MNYIGIDFSLNNTAVTIFNNGIYKFYVFPNVYEMYNKKGGVQSKFIVYDKLSKNNIIAVKPYIREKLNRNYNEEQHFKLFKANELADKIIDIIPKDESVEIALEGFSYGSSGQSEIDLIMFNTILRGKLYQMKNVVLNIYSPKTIKKFAGSGNANKQFMLEKFKEEKLIGNTFFDYVSSTNEYIKGKNLLILSPITDIIDSYFACKLLQHITK